MRGQDHWTEGVPEETLTRAEAQQVLRRLFRMLRPYRWSMVLVIVMLVGQVGALLGGPALVGHGIDAIRHHDRRTLDRSVYLYLFLAFVALIMGRLVIRLIARMGESFLRGLRMRVFSHLDRKSTRLNSSHTVIYTLSLHDALPIFPRIRRVDHGPVGDPADRPDGGVVPSRPAHAGVLASRSEEHTSELQSHSDLHSFPTRRSSDLSSHSSR